MSKFEETVDSILDNKKLLLIVAGIGAVAAGLYLSHHVYPTLSEAQQHAIDGAMIAGAVGVELARQYLKFKDIGVEHVHDWEIE